MHAVDLARAIARREVSPVEALERVLDRVDVWQPRTRAFSQVHPEEAMDAARRLEETGTRGALPPLHGVPVAVKDLFDVAGWETTGCCQAYRGSRAAADSVVVARLRAAGAVIVGKTNQHELAAGGTNVVSACGATRNPWDGTRMTGGSSGGSAAAVAARVVPAAMGSDTGGSIRIPASMSGAVGLKPTYGRVPLGGAMPLAPSMDTAGPLAATAEDAATVFAVVADEGPGFLAETARSPDGLRIAAPAGFFAARCRPDVLTAVAHVQEVLEEAGARAVEVEVEDLTEAGESWADIAWAELAAGHRHLMRRPDSLYPQTRRSLEHGLGLSALDLLRAQDRGRHARAVLTAALEEADALVVPATPFPAPPLDADTVEVGTGERHLVHAGGPAWFTRAANLAGLPALVVPAGFSQEGLPLGVQLIGRPGEEATLLGLGRAFQGGTDHHVREPDPGGRIG